MNPVRGRLRQVHIIWLGPHSKSGTEEWSVSIWRENLRGGLEPPYTDIVARRRLEEILAQLRGELVR